MNCNSAPYSGVEPFVYLISCHREDGFAFPLIERLAKRGLRIWHDAQLRSTQSQWKHETARNLNKSAAVLVLLSHEFTQTHICRRQFTEVIESKKPVLVIHIDQTMLSLGMKLQIKACKTLNSSFPPDEHLVDKILQEPMFQPCIGEPDKQIIVQAYAQALSQDIKRTPPSREPQPSEQTINDLAGKAATGATSQTSDVHIFATPKKDKPFKNEKSEHMETQGATSRKTPPPISALEKTVITKNSPKPLGDDPDATLIPRLTILPVIASLSTGQAQKGLNGETIIGREAKLHADLHADVRFFDQCKLFSRRHFKLICVDSTCTLFCLHNNNLTVNGTTELPPQQPFRLERACVVEMPGKSVLKQFSESTCPPARFVVAFEQDALSLWNAPYIATLESLETGEIRVFWEFPFSIGRAYPWESGAMSIKTISSDHASISMVDNQFFYEDHSSNGTIINKDILCHNKRHELKSGDTFHFSGVFEQEIGDENFVFRFIRLERKKIV